MRETSITPSPLRKILLLTVPLAAFVLLATFALTGLLKLDQSELPSALIDKPAPDFELADMPQLGTSFSKDDLIGQVTLINVFGSWCAACRIEHDMLMTIGEQDEVPLYGINWIDTPERGTRWLNDFGNPYDRVGNDEKGRNIIDLGVTGAPETFVVDKEGRIRYRHVGPLTQDIWLKTLRPMVLELQAQTHANS